MFKSVLRPFPSQAKNQFGYHNAADNIRPIDVVASMFPVSPLLLTICSMPENTEYVPTHFISNAYCKKYKICFYMLFTMEHVSHQLSH